MLKETNVNLESPLLDAKQSYTPKNPYDSSSFISKGFFSWIHPILLKGQKTYLQMSHLFDVPKSFNSEYLLLKFEKFWPQSINKKHRIMRTLFKAFKYQSIKCSIFGFLSTVFGFSIPIPKFKFSNRSAVIR